MDSGIVYPRDETQTAVVAETPAAPASTNNAYGWTRREHERLTTGTGRYVGDISLPGERWMAVVRSPLPHGRIRGVDTAAAAVMPGVDAVLTAADLDEVPRIPLRILLRPEMEEYTQPVIARDLVRYVGEPVAVVVAASARAAEDAAGAVVLDIDELPVAVDPTTHHRVPIWADCDDLLCGYEAYVGKPSDDADLVRVEETFTTGRDTGLPLETRGLIARWDSDHLDMWGPTKFVRVTRQALSDWFRLPVELVTCHHIDVGGMFGPRGELYPEDFLVPWCARIVGAPVKWIEDRNEHFLTINHSRGQHIEISATARRDGTLVDLHARATIDMGAYARPIGSRVAELTVEAIPGPYRWLSLDVSSRGVATNKTPVGTMRGPATFDTTFARERVLDLLAAKLEMDPIELRLHNAIAAEHMPFMQYFGDKMHVMEYDSGDCVTVAEALFEHMDLSKIQEQIIARRAAGEWVGLGVGLFVTHSGLGQDEAIRLDLDDAGRFTYSTTASEVGQGLATMVASVGATELGLPEADIAVITNDTERFGEGNGVFASRGTIFVGAAARDAALQMRAVLAQHDQEADPSLERSWKAIAPHTVVGRYDAGQLTFGFGAHLAVASVDQGTLEVRVERLGVAYDCGRAIDPGSVHGQLAGASVQGLGGTLFEELVYDDSGQPQSTTFLDFLVPTVAEVPEVEVVILELPGTTANPLGTKGAGEAGIMGVGAAVANAVCAALGAPRSVTHLPIRPSELLHHVPELEWRAPMRRSTVPTGSSSGHEDGKVGGLGGWGPKIVPAAITVALLMVAWGARRILRRGR